MNYILKVSGVPGTTYQAFALTNVPYFEGLCVPTYVEVNLARGISPRILCLLKCRQLPTCTFFTVAGSVCKLWTFTLDESYHLGNFTTPTVTSYWPKLGPTAPRRDVALMKPATSGSIYWIFQSGAMLTYGSMCFPNPNNCTATNFSVNWARVDLLQPEPVKTIVLTAPVNAALPYFANITIRAGNNGDGTDPIVGKTPPALVANNQKVSFNVTFGAFRYIFLRHETPNQPIALCKVQALL
ncbi:uncharacterized protein LOC125177618 [Hyalella azteca]|uniref:Uncharacterized protein LOC125177618 n=1 Tax=Hyalella azteca TaxID=294128 RepID=A0A979FFY7_HYAAZ|nr:uncharacterized protein LOC125177618 [Hyalella azteca]